jgi:hypothetical protein
VLVPGPVNKIFVWVTDRSTNGTYVNGERIPHGEPWKLSPDDHVTLLKRDNASDSRPNIGFRVIMALQKPKLEDHYQILKGDLLGSYVLLEMGLMVVVPLDLFIKRGISRLAKSRLLKLFGL